MIYLVTKQQELFENPSYKVISAEESLSLIKDWEIIQADSETSGIDPHIDKLLCFQLGSKKHDIQIVIDCSTIDICLYKDKLETSRLVFHNGKFDLQFLYKHSIIPRKIYDTMIVEQLLYLGYPSGIITYNLKDVAYRRLNINIDKTVRGEIIWRGLDEKTILYAAGDVMYLEDIMQAQVKECKEKQCLVGAKLECDFVPVIAYLEWCGIKLDETKWKAKMAKDQSNLSSRKEALDKFVTTNPKLSKYYKIDLQGDIFNGFDDKPKCIINWDSSRQVVSLAKDLGFDTTTQDKKTGEDKDSVLEKHLKGQKGINDTFLSLYFEYRESSKVVSTYGQGHLDVINPITGRIHTNYKQLGASSGRMSCGSRNTNASLAKLKKIQISRCTYPNIQQLPSDEDTRSSFVCEKGNLFCSCDYSAKLKIPININIFFIRLVLSDYPAYLC